MFKSENVKRYFNNVLKMYSGDHMSVAF